MNIDNQFYEDIGKLKSNVDNLSIDVRRLCEVVDKSSISLSKISIQLESSIEMVDKTTNIINKISTDISQISNVQSLHTISIDIHDKKIEKLNELATLLKNSRVFTKSIIWFIAAIVSIIVGLLGVESRVNSNIKMATEREYMELKKMQIQAGIEQEKKKDEYTKEKWEKYFMRDSAIAERRVTENRSQK